MNADEAVAYVYSQSVCALIELEAMKAANRDRQGRCEADAYDEKAFFDLIERYGIHHNGVIGIFREVR